MWRRKSTIVDVTGLLPQVLVDRCVKCHAVLEQYDEETISLSIICLATLIHREPSLAAPLLLDMLCATTR